MIDLLAPYATPFLAGAIVFLTLILAWLATPDDPDPCPYDGCTRCRPDQAPITINTRENPHVPQ